MMRALMVLGLLAIAVMLTFYATAGPPATNADEQNTIVTNEKAISTQTATTHDDATAEQRKKQQYTALIRAEEAAQAANDPNVTVATAEPMRTTVDTQITKTTTDTATIAAPKGDPALQANEGNEIRTSANYAIATASLHMVHPKAANQTTATGGNISIAG